MTNSQYLNTAHCVVFIPEAKNILKNSHLHEFQDFIPLNIYHCICIPLKYLPKDTLNYYLAIQSRLCESKDDM